MSAEQGNAGEAITLLRGARAETGDEQARYRLAGLLAEQGKVEELRARAETGDRSVLSRLADLLAEVDEDDEALCLIAQSTNTAPVSADTNAGGIAGNVSLDISFDREDRLNISSTLIGSGKYEIFARISGCENRAAVSASKSCAGGIAGRMEYGLVISCDAVGEVSTAEEYAGGIVGHSSSTIRNSRARSSIAAALRFFACSFSSSFCFCSSRGSCGSSTPSLPTGVSSSMFFSSIMPVLSGTSPSFRPSG